MRAQALKRVSARELSSRFSASPATRGKSSEVRGVSLEFDVNDEYTDKGVGMGIQVKNRRSA